MIKILLKKQSSIQLKGYLFFLFFLLIQLINIKINAFRLETDYITNEKGHSKLKWSIDSILPSEEFEKENLVKKSW